MLLGLIQCWSLAIIISSWTISHFEIPLPTPLPINSSTTEKGNHLVFKDMKCSSFTFPDTELVLNDTNFLVSTLDQNVSAICTGQWGHQNKSQEPIWYGDVDLELTGTGMMNGLLERNDSSNRCVATNFTMPTCNFGLSISKFSCTCNDPSNSDCLWKPCDGITGLVQIGWGIADGVLCNMLGESLGKYLSNRNPVKNQTLPSPRIGSPPLGDNPYIKMGSKIVGILPPLLGGIRLALDVIAKNAASLAVMVDEKLSWNHTFTEPSGSDTSMHLKYIGFDFPLGLKLNLQVVIDYFVCIMKTGECSISGLGLYNLRVNGFNDEDLFVEQIGNAVIDILDWLVLKPDENETTHNNTMNLTLIPGKELNGPPMYTYAAIGVLPASIFIFLTIFSVRYHRRRAHAVEKQEDARRSLIASPTPDSAHKHTTRIILSYSVFRGVFRDAVILLLCNSALIMFVYANASTAVTVTLADEIRIFAFSLQNSVHDFWNSGLKALAFFIALFSGAYPYFKLVVIVVCSVIHRNTKSRALRIIDSIGRYSFLDSFVMMVLVTTLQVKGIALVHAHPPFYSFILATVLSMIAGNIATHTYDSGLIVTVIDDDDEENISFEKANASSLGSGKLGFYNRRAKQKKIETLGSTISVPGEDNNANNRGDINASTNKSSFLPSSTSTSPPLTVSKSNNNNNNNNGTDLYGSTSPITSGSNKEKEYYSQYNSEDISSSSSAGTPATQQADANNTNGNNNKKTFPSSSSANQKLLSGNNNHNKAASPTDSAISETSSAFPVVSKNNNNNDTKSYGSDSCYYQHVGEDEGGEEESDSQKSRTSIPASPTKRKNRRNDDDEEYPYHNTGIFKYFIDIPFLEKPWCTKPKIAFFLFFMFAAIWAPIIYGWLDAPLRYHFSGFVTVLQGTHQDYSLHRLFFETPPVLGGIAIVTIVVAPMLIAIYPHPLVLSYLGPWCSTDVFLLTCIAALLQLHEFIKDQAGPLLGNFINCDATLRTPFYVLLVSAVVQQYYIIKAAMGRDPHTHRATSGAPADNEKPPWLFAGLENF